MTVDAFQIVNTIRASATAAVADRPYVTLVATEGYRVVNRERYSVASYEDFSINWSDYSFEYLAEE